MNKKQGIITKHQKELYYVQVGDLAYMCKARGVFREKKIKPLVGDRVIIQVLDDQTGYIEEVLERKSRLIRPPVANIDQILLVLTLKNPAINYLTTDKYLVMLDHFDIPVKIILNKTDLISREEIEEFKDRFVNTGYEIIENTCKNRESIEKIRSLLKNKLSSFAGPSGVGKSSILNHLSEDIEVDTADVSKKTRRGRHTTRHTELFYLEEGSFVLDTPGFTSLDLSFIEDEKACKDFFPEFDKFDRACKFVNCQHINEPVCGVKDALARGDISKSRYENYQIIRQEIKDNRRY